ncbi:MAG: MMPL family transporter [Actinomycetota bacterium]|nr:MMPL family transporter [Actinomycetota bacterium]
MFGGWGSAVYRWRWSVLLVSAIMVGIGGAWGSGVFGALSDGGFEDPDSESARAAQRIEQTVGRTGVDVIALYRSADLTVDDADFKAAVTETVAALPDDAVVRAVGYYDTESPAFVSADRHSTYVALTLVGDDDKELSVGFDRVRDELAAPGLQTELGGLQAVYDDVNETVAADIARAETLSIPIVLVLCLFLFGSAVAALLPITIGAIAIVGAFALLRVLSLFGDVSIFSVNVVTLLGLGLAIDYALFMVSRFREELATGVEVGAAVARTMATAGRTVAFSGLTVAAALASLLLFPQNFLRSMGFGGMAAVLVAMVAALTVLPALFGVLGHRVDSLRVPGLGRRRRAASDSGGWAAVARSVMRRPVLYVVAIVAALVALGSPFLHAEFGGVDARVLPDEAGSRIVAERLDADFPSAPGGAEVIVTGGTPSQLKDYAGALAAVGGVDGVRPVGSSGDTTLLEVAYAADPQSATARAVIEGVRAVDVPQGAQALVGGETATLVDLLDSLGGTLPWMGLTVALAMFVLLFAAFGSVVLPIKAILMNTVSILASFGVIVWIFQDGHLADLLGFTPTGTIEATQPILMLAILFGLSMDYEVFLLSRVREQWDRTHDNTAAVAIGLQRTGRIITSAALLLVVVIGAFATSGITFIKMIGIGMIVAIILDATVVRALLVPATMRLLGAANWWAPGPLRRWWERNGFREHGDVVEDDPAPLLLSR